MKPTADTSSVPFSAAGEPGEDPRILALLKEYQAEWEAGRRPDRTLYLARHPDLAAQIVLYFDSIDLLQRGAPGLSGSGTTGRLDTGLCRGDSLGEFELVREIGRGGMGVVYEARQPSLNRKVAVKVLPSTFAADRVRLQRFIVEAQAAAAVAHPNIVPVYAVGEDRGLHYYAMRLVDGEALDTVTAGTSSNVSPGPDATRSYPSRAGAMDSPRDSGAKRPVPPASTASEPVSSTRALKSSNADKPAYYRRIAELGAQVARALDHAHQCGVVHRDIKPANLILDRAGHIWITDFGLAQLADGPAVTQEGAAIGTLRYMSPEQAAGDRRRLDHRTDVYSLAATLYELATGRPAFPAEEPGVLLRQIANEDPAAPRTVAARFPIDLETVLLKALQKEPRDRYASAGEFADDLERFLTGRPIQARQPSAWDRASRWASRRPATVAAALVSLVVIVIASGIATAAVLHQEAETKQAYAETQRAYETIRLANEETEKARVEADDNARKETQARQRADALAKAERDRADEAEKRFQRTKKLGDSILKITEEEIGAENPFQGPRRKLLRTALENYRELLAENPEDPKVRAELNLDSEWVEKLLAEQELRREADAAFLLNNPDVRKELKLSSELRRRAEQAFASPPSPGKGPGGRFRPPPGPSQETKIELIKSLTNEQRKRLHQISIQFRSPMVFNEPEVIEALNLSSGQRHQIKSIQTVELGGFGPPGKKDGPPPRTNESAKERALQKILEVLTPEQNEAWNALHGKPFNPNH